MELVNNEILQSMTTIQMIKFFDDQNSSSIP